MASTVLMGSAKKALHHTHFHFSKMVDTCEDWRGEVRLEISREARCHDDAVDHPTPNHNSDI